MLDPRPELPDDTLISDVVLPARVFEVLLAAGMKTIRQIRETSDDDLAKLKNFDSKLVDYLRSSFGLPSSEGVNRQER